MIIKGGPQTFLSTRPYTEINKNIWESCDFGILCFECNLRLPTKNRENWLIKVISYVFGNKIKNFGIRVEGG